MPTATQQILSVNNAICGNIDRLSEERELLSQNLLAQLRNLVEAIMVRIHAGSDCAEFRYEAIKPAAAFVKSRSQLSVLTQFYKLLQKSASHYTMDGDNSERLMLRYYEYLFRIRRLLKDKYGYEVLQNLESFPVNLDASLKEYHEKIVARIHEVPASSRESLSSDRYYIRKIKSFFFYGRVYYEVSCQLAHNRANKFDRIIAFTDIEITEWYAAQLTLQRDSIEVLGKKMPITLIRNWAVSVRACEFKNFSRLLGTAITPSTTTSEYRFLMKMLTQDASNLLDLVDLHDGEYSAVRAVGVSGTETPQLFPMLDEVRRIVGSEAPGRNLLRYLLLRLHNQTLRAQYDRNGCERLSNLRVPWACIPFDTMPFCTSLPGHNPRYRDLVESLDPTGRDHELLARRVLNNVERHGMLYTPAKDLETAENLPALISKFNWALYSKHRARRSLILDKGHIFINGYEDDTVSIVEKLRSSSKSGIADHEAAVDRWLASSGRVIDDPSKKEALRSLFIQSRVALIYGAAGTGKSTLVDHIAHFFNDDRKLFLAHTHPAIDNLRRKVSADNAEYRTISSHVRRAFNEGTYKLLVIDECSTVSNSDLVGVLEKTSFDFLVLVGDVYQIESIQFGNWFGMIRSFIPKTSIFELRTPYRTKNKALLEFWSRVRKMDDDIAEAIAQNGYSSVLDTSLLEAQGKDEVILCLNYDGLYGINNVNRFLQSSNPEDAVVWKATTYKVGDPILFFDSERFRPVIYNNLKGRIVGIRRTPGQIRFDVHLDRPLNEDDVDLTELEWIGGSTVRFSVFEAESSDDDDDSLNTTVPFQVAYAASIHKAQGLEYDSVKIVITEANEDDITHSIFYTAVTRAREKLKIFWTPETQQSVLRTLRRTVNHKDVQLLSSRKNLQPLSS